MKGLRLLFILGLCTAVSVLPGGPAGAQFSDSLHHMVNISSSGNFNRTNDGMTYLFNNGLRYGMKKKSAVLNFNSKWVYGSAPQRLTNNDFTSALDFNLYKTIPRFYYWGLAGFTASYSLKINSQVQSGLGIAYRLIDREHMMLSLSNGILYEYSNIVLGENGAYEYTTLRNSLRLQYRFSVRDFVSFNSAGFYQPSLKGGSDYIITANAGVSVKVWRWVSFSASVVYNNISRTQRENILVTYGLVAERFF